jgi:hypothetical protein
MAADPMLLLATGASAGLPVPLDDPMISANGQHVVIVGLVLMAIAISLILGLVVRRLFAALVFAVALTCVLVALLVAI